MKPDDIPEDVWRAADEALDLMLCNCIEASGTLEQFRIDNTRPIADAILAERNRCAKIVGLYGDHPYEVVGMVADEIAAAIRQPREGRGG